MKNALIAFPWILTAVVTAQPRPANWPTYGADAQRSGWEKADARISKETVKDLQLLWKMKLGESTQRAAAFDASFDSGKPDFVSGI